MSQKTVTIGGVKYDAHTGLRLDTETSDTSKRTSAPAAQIHQKAQRTKTLKRSHVKSPIKKPVTRTPNHATSVHSTKSPMIRRFASHDVTPRKRQPSPQAVATDVASPKHPVHEAAKAAVAAKKPRTVVHQKPTEVKEKEVAKALSKSTSKKHQTHKRPSVFKRHPRLFSIATAGLVVVLLAGYITYANLPFISVKIAAIQAGVKADYPAYRPSGYSLKGPVEYTPGVVTMKFVSNTSSESFTITQSKSDWDSASLQENYVSKEAGDDFITITENGLTIYRYNNNAAWVNGGILHTIKGDAQLSDTQIKRIATSM